ncbi:MAG: hypothetical protein H6828_04520 [Planctomycetes bacterium]|nr:hypothetical protein [Planctomycetota bacterium]
MSSPEPLRHLRDRWGTAFQGFERWPLELEGLPRTPAEIEAALLGAPEGALEYLEACDAPGQKMRRIPLPTDRREFLAPPPGARRVLRAGNLSAWCPGARAWCQRWTALLDGELAGVTARFVDVRAELYLSTPRALVAFHADPSHNFCLQLTGARELHVHDNDDPRFIDADTRPGVYLHRAAFPVYRDDCGDREAVFDLLAGRAAYLPPLAGHWIRNGDELAVSYVISVRTAAEEHEKLVHGMNARLSALGFTITPFGRSRWKDRLKAGAERGLRRVARREPAPAFDRPDPA